MTTTGESCIVCHGSGALADVAIVHPDKVLPQLQVSNVSAAAGTYPGTTDPAIVTKFTASGPLVSAYFPGGSPATKSTDATQLAYLRFSYATLVPATTQGDSPQWQTYTDDDHATADLVCGAPAADGSITCTMTTDVSAAVTGQATYQAAYRNRVLIGVAGISSESSALNVLQDFVPNGAALSTVASRDVVPEAACQKCHGNLDVLGIQALAQQGETPLPDNPNGLVHAGSRYLLGACAVCHTSNNVGTSSFVLQTLIHQIHAAITGIPNAHHYDDWSVVKYPQDVRNCAVCHFTDAEAKDQADYPYGYGQNSANYRNFPTAASCGTCHADVLDANSNSATAHLGGQQPDSACAGCHPATGSGTMSIAGAHAFAPIAVKSDPSAPAGTTVNENPIPEFVVKIAMTPPANAQYYVAGETPVVTVTLDKAKADGTDSGTAVDSGVYTTPTTDPSSAKGVAGGGLSSATLYVYGPRAAAQPVLITGSSVDLRLPSTDPNVTTSSSGFSYKLAAIPATMAPGTYMVQFQGNDYGSTSSYDYVTNSNALLTFQVGTATPELKVAGDACTNCHGDTREHLFDSHGHNAPFDTDWCLACHYTGGHGDPIANRVHAVHDANTAGDLQNVKEPGHADWSDITFPQNSERCAACHISGNTTYQTKPSEMPCYGCHATTADVNHFQQNGGSYGN